MVSKFAPNDFRPSIPNLNWAMKEFNITADEARRQGELMVDHEFLRSYTDWQRVWRNWMRKAEEIQSLRRERKAWKPEVITDEMNREAQRSFDAQVERFANKGRS